MITRENKAAGNIIVAEGPGPRDERERMVVSRCKAELRKGRGFLVGGRLVIARVGGRCRIVEGR